MDITSGLNPAQKEAVETTEGPVLILAGPGSGKTRVITQRIAYLVRACGVNPRNILAVTFTNKAAKEMVERIEKLLGGCGELTIGTFHAICARVLREKGREIGIDPHFVIYDDDDQVNLMKQVVKDIGLDPKRQTPRHMLSSVSRAKSQLVSAAHYPDRSYQEKIEKQCYQRYELLLAKSKALDFDDLLVKVVELFEQQPHVLARYQSRYHHVLVDEFQDTNIAQYVLTRQLAGKYRNICVVGDPDQSIYTWRQADIRNILKFEKDYPDARVVKLEQNYRSTKTILEAAQKIISQNLQRKQKSLWTENEAGAPISVVEAYDEQEEAQFVVSEVERLVKAGEVALRDCVVLYRVNAQSRELEEAFLRFGIPYRLIGGTRFYQRREVKDAIAYLRLASNPQDVVSLRRIINVPQRGIGERSVEELLSWAEEKGITAYEALALAANTEDTPLSPRSRKNLGEFFSLLKGLVDKGGELSAAEMLSLVIEQTGYEKYILEDEEGEERWENIRELSSVAHKYDGLEAPDSLTMFLEEVSLISDIDSYDEKADAVTLTTLHQAKGLEFGVVFMVGMEEKVFPHARALPPLGDPTEMEEERRLCYVGVTRAKKRLYLVRASRRMFLGNTGANLPSRFLADVPPQLVKRAGTKVETRPAPGFPGSGTPTAPAPAASGRRIDLKPGDRVKHEKFGSGVVVSTSPLGGDHQIVVAFEGEGVKKLIYSFARPKMEKAG